MKTNKTNNYGLSGLIAVTILLGCILSSTRVSADNDSVTDQITITVPTTCTMSSSVTTSNEHSASISPGTYSAASGSEYENGIGKTTLTSFCNDYNGFSIYAIGYTGNIEGINTLMGTSMSSGATIDTAVYASGDTTSSWSMKVTKVDNPAQGDPVAYNPQNMTISTDTEGIFSSWHTVPDEYTKVAEYHASTGSSATDGGTGALGAKIETTYAAFIAQTQSTDTYTGQVKYVMIHPYNETTPTIPVATTCTTPVPNLTYMQDLNNSNKSTVLASMVEGAQYYLKDARDEKEYCVSKLKDGNIWMTQNLDHDIVTADNYYTNQNTDIGWDTSTNSYATTTWTANKATYSGNGGIWDTSATGEVIEQSYDPGNSYITQDTIDAGKYFFTCWYENCDATLYDNLTSEWQTYFDSCDAGTVSGCDSSLRPVTTSETGNQHYHLGNFYNWGAAVALNDTSSFTVDSTDANRSICPSGWTLPRGGSYAGSGSVAYLYNQYGYSNHYLTGYVPYENPLYLSFSGEWYSPYSAEYGKTGYYWSGTSRDGTRSYYYAASASSTVSPNGYGARYQGFALRCIAR